MPQPPSQGPSRPLTGFQFAPPTATNKKQALARSEEGGGTSLNGTAAGGSGAVDSVEEQRKQRGGLLKTQAKAAKPSLKPLTDLFPGPSRSETLTKPPSAKPPPKPLNPLAAPPPRPPSAPSTSKPPPLKRQKRVLAADEEVMNWEGEKEADKRTAEKGKGKAVEVDDETVEPKKVAIKAPKTTRPAAKPPEPAMAKPTFRPLATFGVFSPVPESRTSPATSRKRTQAPSRATPVPRPLHTLAAISPFPSASTTPAKPPPASQATPVTRLFGQLSTPVKKEDGDEKKPLEARSILSIAPPKPPVVTEDDEVEVMDAGGQGWSPGKKGKKGGYLLYVATISFRPPISSQSRLIRLIVDPHRSGIASRASTLLSSARTDQTLWLHDFSRTLNSLSLPAPVSSLVEAVPPALRLTVLSIPSLHPDGGTTDDVTLRGGRRTLLAQCRLELDASSPPSPSTEGHPSSPPRDLIGLVLFSLHSYPTSSTTLPPPSPIRSRKDPSSTSSFSASSSDAPRTLYVPTNPHDLQRFIVREIEREKEDGKAAAKKKGVEVWVYDPFYPVELLPEPGVGDLSPFFPKQGAEKAVKLDDGEGEGVEWDEDFERRREEDARKAKEAERQKKTLVVSRFAVLV